MKFQLVIKKSTEEIVNIQGLVNISIKNINLYDLQKLPEIEELLEQLLGYRFHIQEQC